MNCCLPDLKVRPTNRSLSHDNRKHRVVAGGERRRHFLLEHVPVLCQCPVLDAEDMHGDERLRRRSRYFTVRGVSVPVTPPLSGLKPNTVTLCV